MASPTEVVHRSSRQRSCPAGGSTSGAALPQLVDPGAGGVPGQIALLGAVFVAIALVLDGGWALFAGSARQWFGHDPRRLRTTAPAGGAVMVGLGGGLTVETLRR